MPRLRVRGPSYTTNCLLSYQFITNGGESPANRNDAPLYQQAVRLLMQEPERFGEQE